MKEKAADSEGHRGKVGQDHQQQQQQPQPPSSSSSPPSTSSSSPSLYKSPTKQSTFTTPPKSSSTPTPSPAKANVEKEANNNPNNNFDDDYNEWDISIGDLIIDLDADIERQSEGNSNKEDSSPQKSIAPSSSSSSSRQANLTTSTTTTTKPASNNNSSGMSSSFKSNRLSSTTGAGVSATTTSASASSAPTSASSSSTTVALNNSNNITTNNSDTSTTSKATVNNLNNGALPLSIGSANSNHGTTTTTNSATGSTSLQRKSGGSLPAQHNSSTVLPSGVSVAKPSISSASLVPASSVAPSPSSSALIEHQATADKGLKMKIKRKSLSGKETETKLEIVASSDAASLPSLNNSANKPFVTVLDAKLNSGGGVVAASPITSLAPSGLGTLTNTSNNNNVNANPSTSNNTVMITATTANASHLGGVSVSTSLTNNNNNSNHETPTTLASSTSASFPTSSSSSKSSKNPIKTHKFSHKKHDHKLKFDKDKLGLVGLNKIGDADDNVDLESPSISSPNLSTMKYLTNSVISSDEASNSKFKPDKNEESISATKEVGTSTSIATITEPDCLGPCEPGTSVTLSGIVWQETEGGVLVVNVTWRGKTYVGTLLDCTKHDWAPPRFCESPTSDIEAKLGTNTRGKRARISFNSDSVVDTRSTSKLRNGKGRRTANSGYVPPSPAKSDSSLNAKNKRKARPNELEQFSDEIKKNRSKLDNAESSGPLSPTLIECPEPNCSKKYKHINGLKYHQSHAHVGSSFNLNDSQDSEREKGKGELSDGDYDDIADSPKDNLDAPDNDDKPDGYQLNRSNFNFSINDVDGGKNDDNDNVDENVNSPSGKYSDISDENDGNGGPNELSTNNNQNTTTTTKPTSELDKSSTPIMPQTSQHCPPFFNQNSPYNNNLKPELNKFRTNDSKEGSEENVVESNTAPASSNNNNNNNNNNLSSPFAHYPFFHPFGSMSHSLPPHEAKANEHELNLGANSGKSENKALGKDASELASKPSAASSILELQNLKNRIPNFAFESSSSQDAAKRYETEKDKQMKERMKQYEAHKLLSRPKEDKDKKRNDEGVKPTMETTGPPPPTNGFYYNPSFAHYPFEFRPMNHMLGYGLPMRLPHDSLSMPGGGGGASSRLQPPPPSSQSSNGSTMSSGVKNASGSSMHLFNHNNGKLDRTPGLGGLPVSSAHSMMPPNYHKSSPSKSDHNSSSSSSPAYVNSSLMSGSNLSNAMHPPGQPRHPHVGYPMFDYSMLVNQSMHPFSAPK